MQTRMLAWYEVVQRGGESLPDKDRGSVRVGVAVAVATHRLSSPELEQ